MASSEAERPSRPKRRAIPPIRLTSYEEPCTSRKLKKTPLTSTERSSLWRYRFQENDPEGYKKWKRNEAEKKKEYRKRVREEDGCRLKKVRSDGAKRSQRFRERHKKNPQKQITRETRSKAKANATETELQRKKWRERKRAQREKLKANPQKKRRVKERERKRKTIKRSEKKAKELKKKNDRENQKLSISNSSKEGDFSTAASRDKAVYRLKKKLPKNPAKYVSVISGIVNTATPKRRDALRRSGLRIEGKDKCKKRLQMDESVLEAMRETQRSKKKSFLSVWAEKIKEKRLTNYSSKKFDLDRNFLRRASKIPEETDPKIQRPRKRLRTEIEESIRAFYHNPDVSTELPHKKSIKKMKSTRALNMTLNGAWESWKVESGYSISFSAFAARRPSDVRLVDARPWNQCLCEYCCNIELKVQVLNKMAKRKVVKDRYHVNQITQCPKEGHDYRRECYERRCSNCKPENLLEAYKDLPLNGEIQWRRWERVKESCDGKRVTKQKLVDKKGTVKNCLDELIKEAGPFGKHIFVARWQYKQYQKATEIVDKMGHKAVLMHMDFAQNYTCEYQDAIQAVHWGKNSVTIFPIVTFYNCQEHNKLVRECINIVSNDHKHDFHSVEAFIQKARDHLEKQGVTYSREIQFSDGCGSQFKSRGPFADISFRKNTERHFFGSRHGKGPCDGEGGVLKSLCDRAVRGGKAIIRNAEEVADYLSKNHTKQPVEECIHARRKIIFVSTEDIDRDRPSRTVKKSVAGTHALHVIKGQEPGKITTRNLSCFCCGCESGQDCINRGHVDDQMKKSLKIDYHAVPVQDGSTVTTDIAAAAGDGNTVTTTNDAASAEDDNTNYTEAAAAGVDISPKMDYHAVPVQDGSTVTTDTAAAAGDGNTATTTNDAASAEDDKTNYTEAAAAGVGITATTTNDAASAEDDKTNYTEAAAAGVGITATTTNDAASAEDDKTNYTEAAAAGVDISETTTNDAAPAEDVNINYTEASIQQVVRDCDVGSFVQVRVPVLSHRKEEFFVAKVVGKDSDAYRLSYLEEKGGFHAWPTGRERIYVHPKSDVIKVLQTPETVFRGLRPLCLFKEV